MYKQYLMHEILISIQLVQYVALYFRVVLLVI